MNLSEFIKKKLEELGKNRSWLVNFGDIDWSTLSNIDHGKSISKVTQEKLAKALDYTQGDIQACLAEQNPLKNVIVNKKSLAKLKPKPEAPAPDPKDEEPAEVFKTDEPEPDEDDEEQAEYTYSETKKLEQMACDNYRQQLRDMCLRIFSSGIPGTHTMKDIYADIGYAIVKELAQGGDKE